MVDDEHARPQTGGWHAALAGAALGAGLTAWWLVGDLVTTGASKEAVAIQPMLRTEQAQAARSTTWRATTQPVAAPATPAAAGPVTVRYLGQRMEGGRPAVVLSYQGRNVVVPIRGTLDGRYEVVSASEREIVLRDIASATMQRIAFGAGAAAAAAAVEAGPPGETTAVPVRPAKLPPPSKRTSDDLEPEN